jgi:hypothetical protein
MKQNLKIAILMTIVTTVLLGVVYPLIVTGLAQGLFHDKANGQLISRNGQIIGSGSSLSGRGISTRGRRLPVTDTTLRTRAAPTWVRPTRS